MSPEDPARTIPEFPPPIDAGDTPAPDSTPARAGDKSPFALQGPPEGVVPVVKPAAPGSDLWPQIPEFPIAAEIARGGMGVVYAAHDRNLDREVAVKTLLPPRPGSEPPLAAALALETSQFEREARITARLPHPGVPPVHAVGTLVDGRPFLVMKLIKGRTLAAELAAIDCAENLPRLIGIFEQICQTVGYAHSVGIIHRDLKPINIMVGPFGEVQVMDWGLARQINSKDDPDPTGRVAPDCSDVTVQGIAKGTPAFMPPEQAAGAWNEVDARADVFALGGILCVILTGKPPYSGSNSRDILAHAAAADLDEAYARLGETRADAELIALCQRCLASKPADRPTDGKAVAEAIADYRARVEERARAAESRQAAAEAEAREQRKRRRTQLALAAAIGLIVLGGGAFAWWSDKQTSEAADKAWRKEQEQIDEKRIAEAKADGERRVRAEAVRQRGIIAIPRAAELRRSFRFGDASDTLNQSAELLAIEEDADLRSALTAARAELDFTRELDDIRYGYSVVTLAGKRPTFAARYKAAFQKYGIDPFDESGTKKPDGQISKSPIREELLEALQDWAWEASLDPDEKEAERVMPHLLQMAWRVEVLFSFEQNEWKRRYYQFMDKGGGEEGLWVMAEADVRKLTPGALLFLVKLLEANEIDSRPLLERACTARPDDFHLNFALGRHHQLWRLGELKHGDERSALVHLRMAQAIRPDHPRVAQELTLLLRLKLKENKSALVEAERWVRLEPDSNLPNWMLANRMLAGLRNDTGDVRGAIAPAFTALQANPRILPNHEFLYRVLAKAGANEFLFRLITNTPSPSRPIYLQAARLAAHAAAGLGPNPEPAQSRGDLRAWTLRWLNAELAARDSADARTSRAGLLTDPDFAFVRTPDALALLPDAERTQWEQFWSRLRASISSAVPLSPPPGGK